MSKNASVATIPPDDYVDEYVDELKLFNSLNKQIDEQELELYKNLNKRLMALAKANMDDKEIQNFEAIMQTKELELYRDLYKQMMARAKANMGEKELQKIEAIVHDNLKTRREVHELRKDLNKEMMAHVTVNMDEKELQNFEAIIHDKSRRDVMNKINEEILKEKDPTRKLELIASRNKQIRDGTLGNKLPKRSKET